MGFFWDLIQQSQIGAQRERADTLEARMTNLEFELAETQALLRALLNRLEETLGEDIDGDGRIGGA
jgi:uncharacterized coiled-coil protein SlyX